MAEFIWPLAFLVVAMTVVLGLLGPARRALAQWGASYGRSAAEQEAAAAKALAETEEARHELTVRRGALAEETAAEKARLASETAQYETDAKAARECLPAAVEARKRALKARADAEADLAPEAARAALEKSPAWLAEAYATYCEHSYSGSILPFGRWVQGFEGVPRG